MRLFALILLLFVASCATKRDPTVASLLRSMKEDVQQTTLLQGALQSFHRERHRWPTDAADFWAAAPQEQRWLDRSKFRRLEFTPKGDGSTFVGYELALEHVHSGCFNIKPDENQ